MLNKTPKSFQEMYREEIESIYLHIDKCALSFQNAEVVLSIIQKYKKIVKNIFEKRACLEIIELIQDKLSENKAFVFSKEQDRINNEEFKDKLKNVLKIIGNAINQVLKIPNGDTNYIRKCMDTLITIGPIIDSL
ncbi:hypothetical protein U8V72_20350 [Priestia filamentosa]|uniref:hypothetical protein n=1 Tax=Priestia filamentosa TaxID=1402861 RepID=UPI0005891F5D